MAKIKTYQKILNTATEMFAQYGYDGTIMDELAERCEVNKASIYYHHKDKAMLYDNVLTVLFTPIADAVVEAVEAEASVQEKLHIHIHAFAQSTLEHPAFAAILMREMASGGGNMPTRARKQMQRILTLLSDTLKRGEAEGVFKAADVLIIHFMIVGTLNLFVASIPLRASLAKMDQCNPTKNKKIESASKQLSETIVSSLLINI